MFLMLSIFCHDTLKKALNKAKPDWKIAFLGHPNCGWASIKLTCLETTKDYPLFLVSLCPLEMLGYCIWKLCVPCLLRSITKHFRTVFLYVNLLLGGHLFLNATMLHLHSQIQQNSKIKNVPLLCISFSSATSWLQLRATPISLYHYLRLL